MLLVSTNVATEKDYSGKDLSNAVFKDGNLNKAKFDDSNLRFADFTNATLKNASFLNANLENASFSRANLEGADFTGAKLRSASFTDAKAWHAKLAGTEIHLARATFITTDGLREKGFTFDQIDAINSLAKASQEKTSGSLSFHYADLRGCLILGNAEGVDFRDADGSTIAFMRKAKDDNDYLIFAFNFTPVPRPGYRLGVPEEVLYKEVLNSDSSAYGGSNMGNQGGVTSKAEEWAGWPCTINVTLPPLAVIVLKPQRQDR